MVTIPFGFDLGFIATTVLLLFSKKLLEVEIREKQVQAVNFSIIVSLLLGLPVILLVIVLGVFSYSNYLLYYVRLLLVNLIFDVITLVITWRFLNLLLKANTLLSSIILIVLDLITAAMLAFGALYFGLIGSSMSLTILEVWNILFFKLRDESSFGIDPYFWIMHTTFIPSLIHLAILFFALMARYLTLPFLKLFQDASVADKPHYATATTFAFIGSIFSATAALLKWL